MRSVKQTQLNPLYVIFEQHLFNSQISEMDRKTFVDQVLKDYLSFLEKSRVMIPKSLERTILEELSNQIHAMLAKKIYGSSNIRNFLKLQPSAVTTAAKKRARDRYLRLSKIAAKKIS